MGFASNILPELLVHIISDTQVVERPDLDTLVSEVNEIASVCRNWRAVVLNSPSLWRTPVFASDKPRFPWKVLELLLRRAFDSRARVDLTLSFTRYRRFDEGRLYAILVVHQAQFDRLSISWSYWPRVQHPPVLRFPTARSLKLDLQGPHMQILDLGKSLVLENVVIHSPCQLHVGRAQFMWLTSFTLVGKGFRVADFCDTMEHITENCFNVLRASPRLRYLSIADFRLLPSKRNDDAQIIYLHLPRLQALSLERLAVDLLIALLQRLRCPALEHMWVIPTERSRCGLVPFIGESGSSLKSLEVENMDVEELGQALARSSGLKSLSVGGRSYSPEQVQDFVAILSDRCVSLQRHIACPVLEYLMLDGFNFAGHPIADVGALVKSRRLTRDPSMPSCMVEFRRCSFSRQHHALISSDGLSHILQSYCVYI